MKSVYLTSPSELVGQLARTYRDDICIILSFHSNGHPKVLNLETMEQVSVGKETLYATEEVLPKEVTRPLLDYTGPRSRNEDFSTATINRLVKETTSHPSYEKKVRKMRSVSIPEYLVPSEFNGIDAIVILAGVMFQGNFPQSSFSRCQDIVSQAPIDLLIRDMWIHIPDKVKKDNQDNLQEIFSSYAAKYFSDGGLRRVETLTLRKRGGMVEVLDFGDLPPIGKGASKPAARSSSVKPAPKSSAPSEVKSMNFF